MAFLIEYWKIILLAVSLLAVAAMVLANYQKIKQFIMEVRTELSKVSWSTPHELMGSTMVVIVVTLLMAVFIFAVDGVLSKGLRALFS
jgi:preprotein translocase subunit SecE